MEKQEKLQAKKKKQLEASLEREMGDEIIVAGEFLEVDLLDSNHILNLIY